MSSERPVPWILRLTTGPATVLAVLGLLLQLGVAPGDDAAFGVRSRQRLRAGRGTSAGHWVALILGVVVVIFGVFYLIVAGGFYNPAPLVLLIAGVVLVIVGLAETLFETESGRARRG